MLVVGRWLPVTRISSWATVVPRLSDGYSLGGTKQANSNYCWRHAEGLQARSISRVLPRRIGHKLKVLRLAFLEARLPLAQDGGKESAPCRMAQKPCPDTYRSDTREFYWRSLLIGVEARGYSPARPKQIHVGFSPGTERFCYQGRSGSANSQFVIHQSSISPCLCVSVAKRAKITTSSA